MSTTLAPAEEFSLARLLQDAPPVPRMQNSDLTGEFTEPTHLRNVSDADLRHDLLQVVEELKDHMFRMGDNAVALIARYGTTPVERAQVITYIIGKTNADSDELYRAIRVARQFPPEVRRDFKDKCWTWHHHLTDYTKFLGAPDERRAEVLQLAYGLAELPFGKMKAALEELKAECERPQAPVKACLVSETGGRLTIPAHAEGPSLDGYREGRLVGERPLEPQTAGASHEEELRYSALARDVERLKALLDPEPDAEAVTRLLWPQINEIGCRGDLKELVLAGLKQRRGGLR